MAVIGISDKVKESSKEAIKLLNEHDINTIMLTGDNEATARHISMETGIKETFSSLMPADKNRIIREYQEKHPTAMVGDGINDSPALAAADVGIALGAGTDIAMESADLVLIKNDLRDVHTALRICKKVMQNIKENLFWALMYNTICIPIAAGALYYPLGLKLSPMIGTIAMSLSSICVISNALRLKRIKKDYNDDNRKEKQKMKTVNIQGMACPHCQARVTEALKPFDENVVVDHTKVLRLSMTALTMNRLKTQLKTQATSSFALNKQKRRRNHASPFLYLILNNYWLSVASAGVSVAKTSLTEVARPARP